MPPQNSKDHRPISHPASSQNCLDIGLQIRRTDSLLGSKAQGPQTYRVYCHLIIRFYSKSHKVYLELLNDVWFLSIYKSNEVVEMAAHAVTETSSLAKQTKSKTKNPITVFEKNSMSATQDQPCSFGDVAINYRVYILDDLLAEPQEVCHDWLRNLLYISQRYRQGNTFAPIDTSREIQVFDIGIADVVGTIDLRPYEAPHGLELDQNCSYLYVHVTGGALWIDPNTRATTSYASSESITPARQSSNDFIAEVDLRTGRMRQRINVPESESPTDGRFIAFSAPAIRYASRGSASGMPVLDVENDPVIEAVKAKFNVRTIYITSRNIMLV